MWFQHDDAPPTLQVRRSRTPKRYIWTALDRSAVHLFIGLLDRQTYHAWCWGQMKILVHETRIDSVEELIASASGEIRDIPAIFQTVRNSMQRRCEVWLLLVGNSNRFCNVWQSKTCLWQNLLFFFYFIFAYFKLTRRRHFEHCNQCYMILIRLCAPHTPSSSSHW